MSHAEEMAKELRTLVEWIDGHTTNPPSSVTARARTLLALEYGFCDQPIAIEVGSFLCDKDRGHGGKHRMSMRPADLNSPEPK